MGVHKRGWYLDRFGVERPCVVVTASGLLEAVLMVLDADGEQLDVDPADVYYIPTEPE